MFVAFGIVLCSWFLTCRPCNRSQQQKPGFTVAVFISAEGIHTIVYRNLTGVKARITITASTYSVQVSVVQSDILGHFLCEDIFMWSTLSVCVWVVAGGGTQEYITKGLSPDWDRCPKETCLSNYNRDFLLSGADATGTLSFYEQIY